MISLIKAEMQPSSINKHISKLEYNLLKIEELHNKGCAVNSSLGEAYLDLKDLGAYLNEAQAKQNDDMVDQELAELGERYKTLWVKFEAVADAASMQDQGMVMASNKTLPDFFCQLTSRFPAGSKLYERIAALFGIGMVGFSLISPTYYLLMGKLPFLSGFGQLAGTNALVLVLGAILGLLVHESAHGIVLANNGIKIERIGAMAGSMVGGFVEAEETSFFQADPKVHLRFNAAGIGTNALLALILITLGVVTSTPFLVLLAIGNLFFGFINSFPISPLDGGWVFEDLIKFYLAGNIAKRVALSLPLVVFILWIILFIRLALL